MGREMEEFEMMEAYYEGGLSKEEKASFEAKLLLDENFNQEYELYKNVRHGIYKAGENELREKLKSADKEITANKDEFKENKTIPLYKKLLVAVSIAAFVTASGLYYLSKDFKFQKFEEREPGLPVMMDSNDYSPLDKAMTLYKAEDYAGSKEIIKNLLASNPNNDTLLYYSGVINYELKKYSEAAEQFKEVAGTESVFNDKAAYRLALSYLRNDKKEEARAVLEEITKSPSHLYKEQSEEILKTL